jgi:hypothetical protein
VTIVQPVPTEKVIRLIVTMVIQLSVTNYKSYTSATGHEPKNFGSFIDIVTGHNAVIVSKIEL